MIPDWNNSAVLPPVRPGAQGHSPDRSPYRVIMTEVIERFATSTERIEILRGLLTYRAALRQSGIVTGFQWLNGSFMENKELLQNAAPNDVDVVTFFNLPDGIEEQTLVTTNPDLFDNQRAKEQFHVDAYSFVLGQPTEDFDVRNISYWYSMWSHRRNGLWKGFVQVDIAANEDENASVLLDQIEQEITN
jgi:hypothetical protein